jgi:hypothetical protein
MVNQKTLHRSYPVLCDLQAGVSDARLMKKNVVELITVEELKSKSQRMNLLIIDVFIRELCETSHQKSKAHSISTCGS